MITYMAIGVIAILAIICTLFLGGIFRLPSRFRRSAQSEPSAQRKRSVKSRLGDANKQKLVQVLVLGDIGRSPRMQYHVMSIAKTGARVELIGYAESDPHPDILHNRRVSVVPLPDPLQILQTENRILFLLFGPLKVAWQAFGLFVVLGYRAKPAEWLLVQNPPSIPTLIIAQAVCFLRNTKLIIDWHNFGWTNLALKLGEGHILVRISKWYEHTFGRYATANFAVTDAMTDVLKENYHVRSPVLSLHDRPSSMFQPFSLEQRTAFLRRLPHTSKVYRQILRGDINLLVSSTSWTADEDFSMLLDALMSYSRETLKPQNKLPRILAIITGKGPQKSYYLERISRLQEEDRLSNVTILTAWLDMADYAALLGCADLGVSLHTSTSGLDLPMKVVDMFGAGLPVVGWSKFASWKELVKEGENGCGFGTSAELGSLLVSLFGTDRETLALLKKGAIREGGRRWDDEWNPIAGRILGLCE